MLRIINVRKPNMALIIGDQTELEPRTSGQRGEKGCFRPTAGRRCSSSSPWELPSPSRVGLQ